MQDSEEVIYVDDERIKKHFIREVEEIHDIHYHYDPRMVGVYSFPIQVRMWEGEYVELDVPERAVMLGVVTELAAHHPRARLYVNDVNQTPQYLDTFIMGEVDGIGCIKWFMLPAGRKKVRLKVTGSYNPIMNRKQRIRGSGFCFGGFIVKNTFDMPTPVYTTVSWTHNDLNSRVIPKATDDSSGSLDIADLPHQCKLRFMKTSCDSSDVEVNLYDGWGEGPYGNLTYRFTLRELYDELESTRNREIQSYGAILRWDENEKSAALTLSLSFMAGMRIRLRNLNDERDVNLLNMRCVADVRLC